MRRSNNTTPPQPPPTPTPTTTTTARPPRINAPLSSIRRPLTAAAGVPDAHDARTASLARTDTALPPFTAAGVSQPKAPKAPKAPSILVASSRRPAPTQSPQPLLSTKANPKAAPSPVAARLALRVRDRNAALSARPAAPRFPVKTITSSPLSPLALPPMRNLRTASSSTMGYDKDTPRKPTLASRPITRAPLTPKIASSSSAASSTASFRTPTTSPYQQTVTVSTPLARRVTGLSSTSSTTSHNNHREDAVVSPVPAYLNNVTPRSGSRQNRVDSGSPTPTSTPASGLGIAGSSVDPDAKFFYASTAPASASASTSSLGGPGPASPALAPPSRASTFFYANGQSLPGASSQPPPLASPTLPSVTSSPPPPDLASKFVHANGAALEKPQQPKLAASVSVSSSRAPTPQSRPLSPVKMAAVSPYQLQKSASATLSNATAASSYSLQKSVSATLSLNAAAASMAPPGPTSPSNGRMDMLSRQRSTFSSSIGSNSSVGSGHSRKGSLTIADPPTVARLLHSSQPGSEASSPASAHFPSSSSSSFPFPNVTSNGTTNAAATSGLAAILQATEDLAEEDESGAGLEDRQEPNEDQNEDQPPGSPAPDIPPQVDALVTNARRERKVQDLEITNASLEAINRSLERQLRKQKNELRQFRRLSRSGRLSLAPAAGSAAGTAAGSRITSSSTVEGPLQDTDRILSVLSEDDDDEDGFFDGDDYASDMEVSFNDDDEDDDSDDNSDGNSSDEPTARRRKRDERRLQLDLAQHRQLLVDSQKINQSIKRCMGWTEALIQEGRKALAFQVRVSEVQLGGRVLAADEVEERREQREREEREKKELEQHESSHTVAGGDDAKESASIASSSVVVTADGSKTASLSSPRSTTTASISTASSDGHDDRDDPVNQDEAFSPVSHNIRSVRFDTDLVDEKTVVGVDLANMASLDEITVSTVQPTDTSGTTQPGATNEPRTPPKPPSLAISTTPVTPVTPVNQTNTLLDATPTVGATTPIT